MTTAALGLSLVLALVSLPFLYHGLTAASDRILAIGNALATAAVTVAALTLALTAALT